MPDETSERQEMQDRVIQSMRDFAAENPALAEAMAVMNMTMPDYYLAMESIPRWPNVTASAYIALPFQVQENS